MAVVGAQPPRTGWFRRPLGQSRITVLVMAVVEVPGGPDRLVVYTHRAAWARMTARAPAALFDYPVWTEWESQTRDWVPIATDAPGTMEAAG